MGLGGLTDAEVFSKFGDVPVEPNPSNKIHLGVPMSEETKTRDAQKSYWPCAVTTRALSSTRTAFLQRCCALRGLLLPVLVTSRTLLVTGIRPSRCLK